MKKSLVGLAFIGALFTAPAMAADMAMPVKAPPAPTPAPAFSWTGFYIGAQGGGGWGSSSATENDFFFCPAGGVCAAPTPVVPGIPVYSNSLSGAFGGVTVGANYQFSAIVVGVEGDWSAADINGTTACNTAFIVAAFGGTSGTCGNKVQDFATVTGRLGWAWNSALIYVKGGGAWARYNDSVTSIVLGIPGPAANFSNDRSGWTVGVGVEYAFTQNWSFKVEYDHMDFGTSNLTYPFVNVPPFAPGTFNTTNSESQRLDIVRAGVNYRFNWWGGPIATRY